MTSVIKINNLSKKYVIGHQKQERYTTLRDVMMHKMRGIGQRLRHPLSPNREEVEAEEFWALKDINLEIEQGERVGIIGRNGAGKSTLLKVLSRITEPTSGKIHLNGRVASLLEVGTGFHPELSGRENIYLNGAILGMGRNEIKKKFDEIVDFSGVEKFLDTPVKRYSSGMYVRLAFAVAAHLEPEILIVDEVLSVGDAQFQKKCLGKMQSAESEGRTVLFVSHNIGAVSSLCSRAVLLDRGKMVLNGNVASVIEHYISGGVSSLNHEKEWLTPEMAPGDKDVRLKSVRVICDGEVTGNIPIDKDINIEVEFWNFKAGEELSASIHLIHSSEVTVLATANLKSACIEHDGWTGGPYRKGLFKTVCTIPGNFLNEGTYSIKMGVLANGVTKAALSEAVNFTVYDSGAMRAEYSGKWVGVIRPRMDWKTSLIEEL